jgi:hypothetical protein
MGGRLGRLGVQHQQQDQAPQADREQEQAKEELKAVDRQVLGSLHEGPQRSASVHPIEAHQRANAFLPRWPSR